MARIRNAANHPKLGCATHEDLFSVALEPTSVGSVCRLSTAMVERNARGRRPQKQ